MKFSFKVLHFRLEKLGNIFHWKVDIAEIFGQIAYAAIVFVFALS